MRGSVILLLLFLLTNIFTPLQNKYDHLLIIYVNLKIILMKPKNVEFIEEFIEILGGDNFFLCDLIDQDELFTMQDRLAKLICDHANGGTGVARHLVPLLPSTFKVE